MADTAFLDDSCNTDRQKSPTWSIYSRRTFESYSANLLFKQMFFKLHCNELELSIWTRNGCAIFWLIYLHRATKLVTNVMGSQEI